MARKPVAVPASFLAIFPLVLLTSSLFGQQVGIQSSFFAPAAARVSSGAANIHETENYSYLTSVQKEVKPGASAFQPNPSDLLIQQAEERFNLGKKLFDSRNYDQARTEFDAAIDDMLGVSIAGKPTDQGLFEVKLERMLDSIHQADLTGLGGQSTDDPQSFDKAPIDDILNMTFPIDPQSRGKIEAEVKKTTSGLPLVLNDAVLGYVNYFGYGRGRKTIENGLTRAGKYEPMISRILAEEGVPQELIHLAQAESGFLPRAVSRAAAKGMWQFVKFRGNEYGLMQTQYSDDRLDPEKATRAAAHHLHDLYNEFGDWYLAIAAYNCGPGGVEKAVEHTGYADFWELRARHAIPNETANYVPIIVAMTIVAKNAEAYGIGPITPDAPLEYDTIKTSAPTSIALLADLTDTSTAELLQLNPALLKSMAPSDFDVRVPKGMGQQVAGALDLIPADHRASWRSYRIESGDTIAAIARQFNAPSGQILSANNLTADAELNPGDRLMIPASYHELVPQPAAPRKTAGVKTTVRKTTAATHKPATHAAVVHTTATPVKRPVHATAGTIAELKTPRPSNR